MTRHQLTAALVEWLATPADLRQPRNLRRLAARLGVRANGHFYQLARDGETACMALALVVEPVLPRLPRIVESLAERAAAGDLFAGETILRHIRELLASAEGAHPPSRRGRAGHPGPRASAVSPRVPMRYASLGADPKS